MHGELPSCSFRSLDIIANCDARPAAEAASGPWCVTRSTSPGVYHSFVEAGVYILRNHFFFISAYSQHMLQIILLRTFPQCPILYSRGQGFTYGVSVYGYWPGLAMRENDLQSTIMGTMYVYKKVQASGSTIAIWPTCSQITTSVGRLMQVLGTWRAGEK